MSAIVVLGTASKRDAPELIHRMQEEQPTVLAYLLAVDDDILNQDERRLMLSLGWWSGK